MRYLLGYDIGSSSIKAALVEVQSGKTRKIVQYPESEMEIITARPDWAEQDPNTWWDNVCYATKKLLAESRADPGDIGGIGIAYQMHGLVVVDKNLNPLRPSIIWCDSRAVEIGNQAFEFLGKDYCQIHLLNSPGNFTASKLAWVKEYEPDTFNKIYKIMLPGDYIAMKLTGKVHTTISGLSEGILWDFKEEEVARPALDYFGFNDEILPVLTDTFSVQGELTASAAEATGLNAGIPLSYRAGDQPNNAYALGVNNPGEVAATGGTSGVVYGIAGTPVSDPGFRVNTFAHVTHRPDHFRAGVLLCINGAGITYSWLKNQVAQEGMSFPEMEKLAEKVEPGSEDLKVFSFGNGAERMLHNRNIGAHVMNLNFNRHGRAHLFRAGLEGVAFSFVYGMEVMQEIGLNMDSLRVGNDNLFQSRIFSETITGLLDCSIEVIATTGASGAARGAGYGAGIYSSAEEAAGLESLVRKYESGRSEKLADHYQSWKEELVRLISP